MYHYQVDIINLICCISLISVAIKGWHAESVYQIYQTCFLIKKYIPIKNKYGYTPELKSILVYH
jgi:hypothetical protein